MRASVMILTRLIFLFGLLALAAGSLPVTQAHEHLCGHGIEVEPDLKQYLTSFAGEIGLRYPQAFAGVVATIQNTGRAPDCYLSKQRARLKGWRRGMDLCSVATGHAIGAYPFENREGMLPKKYEGSYRIADLDFDCGRRGAKRLVYVKGAPGEWLIWVTLDHYKSYIKVPAPGT